MKFTKERLVKINKGTGKIKYQIFFIAAGIGVAYYLMSPFIRILELNPKLQPVALDAVIALVIVYLVLKSIVEGFQTIKEEELIELNMPKPPKIRRPEWSKRSILPEKISVSQVTAVSLTPSTISSPTSLTPRLASRRDDKDDDVDYDKDDDNKE